MNKQQKYKKTILKIHEILGLVTGIVLFIVSITGCLWAFKDEIEALNAGYKTVKIEQKTFIPPLEVKSIAEKSIPNRTIHGVIYGQPQEAIEVVFYEDDPIFYQSLFLNPYSGEVLKKVDHKSGFFSFVLDGHQFLWLPKEIGSNVVTISVLLFLVILVSGIYLWWPKNKKGVKQRISFKWKKTTGWKRKNFDLHTVIGFYIYVFAFTFAFTGCIMGFNWFYYIAFKATGGNKAPQFIIPANVSNPSTDENTLAIDGLLPVLQEKYSSAESFELHYPTTDTSSILVEAVNSKGLHYNIDYLFFDQHTLEEIETTSIYGRYENADFADHVIRMNYDIHIGIIGGIWGKIIAFIASLITASLPVSGILLWYGRRFKKKKE